MDKLQPLITHRFWILFGLALIMPWVGWFMASGEVKATIEERTGKVKQAVTNSKSGSIANKLWTDDLTKVNDTLEERFVTASSGLWDNQKSLMVWPGRMVQTMKNRPYRWHTKEEFAKEVANTRPKYTYQSLYAKLHEEMVNTVNPLRVDDKNKVVGNVRVNPAMIHATPIPPQGAPPSWDIIWDAQEDLWLTKNLLEPIQRINGDLRITEVPVREIVSLQLLGGSRSGKAGSGSKSGSGGGNSGGEGEDDYESAMRGGLMMGGGSGGGYGGTSSIPEQGELDFDPADEFGAPEGGAAAASGGFSIGARRSTTAVTKVDRFVDEDENMPFRTRGFKMHAVVRGDNVQEFLTELMTARFPVEISRFHRVSYHIEPSGGMSGGIGGGMGMGMGGGGMGMGMGGGGDGMAPPGEGGGGGMGIGGGGMGMGMGMGMGGTGMGGGMGMGMGGTGMGMGMGMGGGGLGMGGGGDGMAPPGEGGDMGMGMGGSGMGWEWEWVWAEPVWASVAKLAK